MVQPLAPACPLNRDPFTLIPKDPQFGAHNQKLAALLSASARASAGAMQQVANTFDTLYGFEVKLALPGRAGYAAHARTVAGLLTDAADQYLTLAQRGDQISVSGGGNGDGVRQDGAERASIDGSPRTAPARKDNDYVHTEPGSSATPSGASVATPSQSAQVAHGAVVSSMATPPQSSQTVMQRDAPRRATPRDGTPRHATPRDDGWLVTARHAMQARPVWTVKELAAALAIGETSAREMVKVWEEHGMVQQARLGRWRFIDIKRGEL